jgi:hypothetical protein
MQTLLIALRTVIGMGVAFTTWLALVRLIDASGTVVGTLVPVWVGGLLGGLVCALFGVRQAVSLAFTCGLLLALGFLWLRHGVLDLDLGQNTLLTLWPVWFPPAFYVGAYGYLKFLQWRSRI